MTTLEFGAIALVLTAVFFYLRIFAKTRAVLAFIGTCIVTGGLFGEILGKIAIWVDHLTNAATAKVFGAGIPGLVLIVLAVIFIHDLHPRHSAGHRALWAGIALAACLVAGISGWSAVNHIPADVKSSVGNVKSIG